VIHHGSLVPNSKPLNAKTSFLLRSTKSLRRNFTLALTSLPLQRNLLNLLGKIKTQAQKFCKLNNTEFSNCSLPANDNFLINQESILEEISEIKLLQSTADMRLVISGTPRYLTGRPHFGIFRT